MWQRTKLIGGALLVLLCAPVGMASAQYTSPNYRVDQTFFGAGGELQDLSAHYQAKVAAGELGIDHSVSPNYQIYSGFNTTDKPLLEVAVTGGVFDLGALDQTQTKAITTDFTIRNYLSSGYVVRIGGAAPTNGNHPLCSMGWDAGCLSTTSSPGTEQFGINLWSNNLPGPSGPGAFGAVPAQIPDMTFGFGFANGGYNIPNEFVFVPNDIVAKSNSSSGITDFTLSAIANISSVTPGGFYGTSLFVNVVATF